MKTAPAPAATSDVGVPVLDVRDVTKVHRLGEVQVHALRGVTLRVDTGEFVAITGPSGSGKTTLLSILACLDAPTSGSYRLVGEEVARLAERDRAKVRGRRIGVVFQAYNLLARSTAYENVELPLVYAGVPARRRPPRVLAALEQVGLAHRADHRPGQLSGGEQQRVGIARALVANPALVLADEPTGNLDSRSAADVLAILDRLHIDGTTIVVITHSEEVAARASRRLRIADGDIVGDDLRCAPDVMATT